jgi:hypothetical protein
MDFKSQTKARRTPFVVVLPESREIIDRLDSIEWSPAIATYAERLRAGRYPSGAALRQMTDAEAEAEAVAAGETAAVGPSS